MKTSRDLADLQPGVRVMAEAFLAACRESGIDVLVTCTLRDWESQASLYEQGRTKPGSRVTNAKAGDSAHNYGLAFDVVPLRDGKPVWGTIADRDRALWVQVGKIGEACGLEWGGRWNTFLDLPHFQDLGGKTLAELRNEYRTTQLA